MSAYREMSKLIEEFKKNTSRNGAPLTTETFVPLHKLLDKIADELEWMEREILR